MKLIFTTYFLFMLMVVSCTGVNKHIHYSQSIQQREIFFAFDQDRVEEEDKTRLKKILESMSLEKQNFVLSGHTDQSGSLDYNYDLADRRARAVKAYLLKSGVRAGQIQTVSFGETKLKNEKQPYSSENRRVVIEVNDGL